MISFEAADFGLTPVFSNVTTFAFGIDIAGPLTAGTVYSDPTLNGVDYNVFGTLDVTPSGFPAFNLVRSIGGAEFYTQGSSLSFEVAVGADLTDGLQVSDLVGDFIFDGREVGTGRYHPALFQLHSDGTGSIRNSNNTGGVNPGSGEVVNVTFGEEYITDLTFNASTLTLADAPAAVPVPPVGLPLLMLGFMGAVALRRRH
ncbi:MAG: hypothetical protein GKS01_16215 [Alphaproteobacteria bacterium]|nr:hypothetical protein [Alphaproteobacteria bacterium]